MKDMKINDFADYTLKAVKNWNTDDGGGFCANLYNGSKKVAYVLQDGNGGDTSITFTLKAEEQAFEAHVKSLPAVEYPESWGGGLCTINGDIFVDELLNDYIERQQIKKFLKNKNKTYGKVNDTWYSWNCPDTPENRIKIKQKEHDIVFINEVKTQHQ